MIAEPSGRRVLLAPSPEVAAYVGATYHFDEVRVVPVDVEATPRHWRVRADGLELEVELGGRPPLGWLLRLVPRQVAEAPWWTRVTDPIARLVLRGVRTRGTAGGGRTETYGATDLRRVLSLRGTYDGTDLGRLAPVDPEPGFGFGSTPKCPSVTTVATTVLRPE